MEREVRFYYERLRNAILALAVEDIGTVGEMNAWTEEVVFSFNDLAATERGRGVDIQPIDTDNIYSEKKGKYDV